MMELTILGNSGTCPIKDGACSSYLLEIDGIKLLIDMGNGSITKLQHKCNLEEIDSVIISHLHFDHFADLVPYKYALETKKEMGAQIKPKLLMIPEVPLWLNEILEQNEIFYIKTISDDVRTHKDNIEIIFKKVPHLIDSFAICIKNGNSKFVYSSDSGDCDEIVEIAKDADLFLCEATLLEKDYKGLKHHLTAAKAAKIAAKANVKRLLLTHFWMDYTEEMYLEEAKKYFPQVEISKALETYKV